MLIPMIFAVILLIASIVFSIIEKIYEIKIKENNEWNKKYGSEVLTDEQIKMQSSKPIGRLKKIIYSAFGVIFLVFTIFQTVFFTSEQEIAFTTKFGVATMVEGSGMHFKIPYITKVYKCDATSKGMAIGYDPETNKSVESESLMITSDFNLVNTDFYVTYRITDPIQYVFGSNDPEGILRNMVQASIRNTVGLYGIDSVITTGKTEIQSAVKEQVIKKLEQHQIGLSIVDVTIQDAEPPTKDVANAFKAVEDAKQDADTSINTAKQQEKEKIPNAQAEADKIIKDAEATKTERINQANQEVAEFKALYQKYRKNPETVKKQLYYDTMEEILPNMEIVIGDSKVIYVKNNGEVTQQ